MINEIKSSFTKKISVIDKRLVSLYKTMIGLTATFVTLNLIGLTSLSLPIVILPLIAPVTVLGVAIGTCVLGMETCKLGSYLSNKLNFSNNKEVCDFDFEKCHDNTMIKTKVVKADKSKTNESKKTKLGYAGCYNDFKHRPAFKYNITCSYDYDLEDHLNYTRKLEKVFPKR